MKIIKHKLAAFIGDREVEANASYYLTKEEAVEREYTLNHYTRKYAGEVEVDIYCEGCDRDLTENDEFLKVDEQTRYCTDCFEEESYTYYTVGGEQVSDENDSEVHCEGESLT